MSIFGDAKPRDSTQYSAEKRQARREQERLAILQEKRRIELLDLRLKRCEQSISKMDFKMSNVMKTLQATKHSIARVHLLLKIKDQVEFYFSDANLINDIFLLKHMYKSGNEQDN